MGLLVIKAQIAKIVPKNILSSLSLIIHPLSKQDLLTLPVTHTAGVILHRIHLDESK
jgi:hypothetical protein